MWLETLSRAIKDIRDIMAKIPHIEDVKELNKLELKLHNMFQEYYGVLGNVTREVKQAINSQKLNIKHMDRVRKETEQNEAIEKILNETPEQEVIDASKLEEPEKKPAKKKTTAKKTTKKKTTKKADK